MKKSAHDAAAEDGVNAIYDLQGVAATYTPNGGDAVTVKVLVDDRSRMAKDSSASRSRVHTLRGSVRVSEVEELGRGDTIQLAEDDVVFRILPSSCSNDGLEWDFEANGEVTTTVGNVAAIPDR